LLFFLALKKNFVLSPPSAQLEPGFRLEIKCTLPNAKPDATIAWQKNGEELEASSAITLASYYAGGSLIIHSTRLADSGNYTCVAENIVGKRYSDPVQVLVRNEKRWSEWSSCSSECLRFRRRSCNPKLENDCSDNLVEKLDCRDGLCQERPASGEGSDRIVYFSLIIVSVLCVILAALFAHSKRKKPEIPDYIVTDNGKA